MALMTICMHVCWDLIFDDIVMYMFASTVCPDYYLLSMYKSCIKPVYALYFGLC